MSDGKSLGEAFISLLDSYDRESDASVRRGQDNSRISGRGRHGSCNRSRGNYNRGRNINCDGSIQERRSTALEGEPSSLRHERQSEIRYERNSQGGGRGRGRNKPIASNRFVNATNIQNNREPGFKMAGHNETMSKPAIKNSRIMEYKDLEPLLLEDPNSILKTLANPLSGFSELLTGQKLEPKILMLIVCILKKVYESEYEELKISVFSKSFSDEFINEVKRCSIMISLEDDQEIRNHVETFFTNVVWLFERIIDIFPSLMNERMKSLMVTLNLSMKNSKEILGLDLKEDLFDQVKMISEQITSYIETKKKMDSEQHMEAKYVQAPNDFRELSLVPTKEDFLSGKTYLNRNIVKGAYKNVEHYLNVQFRLLREDFIAPLREGIYEYTESLAASNLKRKYSNVHIYSKVKFLEVGTEKGNFGYLVHFDCDGRLPRNINWEYSKRFMFGALLLFTNDNFNTFYVATVEDCSINHLQKRTIVVDFVPGTIVPENLFDPSLFFVMAASMVYYEAYLPVLAALKKINENNFPMRQYIVDADTKCFVPFYILFKPVYKISGFQVNLLDNESWPSPDQLKLNPSQHHAFKSALINEFSVIQGPPGTGKTYLALRITEVLLKNSVSDETPLVVICYTNHALDQFLEGILKYTNNVIRIGGQCQNESIKKLNINTIRNDLRKKSLFTPSDDYFSVLREKQELQYKLESITEEIDSLTYLGNYIMDIYCLKQDMTQDHYDELLGKEVDWLLGCDRQHLHSELEEPQIDMSRPSYEGDGRDLKNVQYQEILVSVPDSHEALRLEEEVVCHGENARLPDFIANEEEFTDNEEESDDDASIVVENSYQSIYYGRFKIRIEDIITEIKYYEEQLECFKNLPYYSRVHMENEIKEYIQELKWQIDFIHQQSIKFKDLKLSTANFERFQKYESAWQMQIDERWEYYISLIHMHKCRLRQSLQELTASYQEVLTELSEVSQMSDLRFVRDADVIGMTTSGAAKRRVLLENLDTKIVIVEEAAEVLEAHIVTSLAQSVQHVILIGDHKQLRPSPAVFDLAKKYQMDVSLFERMLINGLDCSVLDIQHRMRPEIASLIAPSIYPTLTNHPTTVDLPRISGVDKFVFFLTHNHLEEQLFDSLSCQNTHEGDFLLALCHYLLLQGYQPHEITILTPYVSQMWYLKKQRRILAFENSELKNVRITPVDNFQGEENRIILLSLVKSNKEGRIGFLGIENRVCVALSRAREGLYIVGNLDMLVANSQVWSQLKHTLQQMSAVGRELVLRCERHPDHVTRVSSAKDFIHVPKGGCAQPCQTLLDCGHVCPSVCHIIDQHHGFTNCDEPCSRKPCAEEGHTCPLKCHQTCLPCKVAVERDLLCGHSAKTVCHVEPASISCRKMVPGLLELCGHSIQRPCYLQDTSLWRCDSPCPFRLYCGHACTRNCHLNDDPDHLQYNCYKTCGRVSKSCRRNHTCSKMCYEPCGACTVVLKIPLPCGHYEDMACAEDESKIVCTKPCTKTLPCGHRCILECNQPCNFSPCKVRVDKECPHGHTLKSIQCGESVAHRLCKERCPRSLPCGHPCPGKCGDACVTVDCKVLVKSVVAPACGHPSVMLPCFLNKPDLAPASDTLLQFCGAPCEGQLRCGHTCTGNCNNCMQGRLHVPCSERCNKMLLCGHRCKAECKVLCPPCKANCSNVCEHNFKCFKKCCEPCAPCTKPCQRGCEHKRCPGKCGSPCKIILCNKPCTFKLKCGHDCIGLCGENHPKLCRVCDADNPIISANPASRFLVLADCNHIVDIKEMPKKLVTDDPVLCPHCSKHVIKTRYYRNRYLNHRRMLDLLMIEIKEETNSLRSAAIYKAEECLELVIDLSPVDQLPYEITGLLDYFLNSQKPHAKSQKFKKIAQIPKLNQDNFTILLSLVLPLVSKYCQEMVDYRKFLRLQDWRRAIKQRISYLSSVLWTHTSGVSYEDILQIELEVSRILQAFDHALPVDFDFTRPQVPPELTEQWLDMNTYTGKVFSKVELSFKIRSLLKYQRAVH